MAAGAKKAPGASKELEAFTGELRQESRPARREIFSQLIEALRTGGIGARLPIAQRAVESSLSAASQAQKQLGEQLAFTGLAGTPFGESIRAETSRQGAFQTSQIPTNIAQAFIQQAPSFVTGASQNIVGGLGAAGNQQAAVQQARIAAFAKILSTAIESASQSGDTIGALAALCWVARTLYSPMDIRFHLARTYANGTLRSTWWGRILHWLYRRYGPTLALQPAKCEWFRPLFDRTWRIS